MSEEFSALGRLKSVLSTADGQKAYLAWMRDGMTEQLLLAGSELAKPESLGDGRGLSAEYLLGICVGRNDMLTFLRTLQITATGPKPREIKPTYGSN